MYRLFRILKKLLPKQLSEKFELKFRKLYSNLFIEKGDCHCTICNQSLKSFIDIEKGEKLCPACGSGKRHRRLFSILKEEYQQNEQILDFSPNIGFSYYARKAFGRNYLTTDYDSSSNTDFHLDIISIDKPDNQFDKVICYHVLEHIVDDAKAMSELFRILKKGGKCYIQTPYKVGEIYEDFTITSSEERLKHFHQEDHVRIYSVVAQKERLEKADFQVEIRHFKKGEHPREIQKFGFKEEEFILVATKL